MYLAITMNNRAGHNFQALMQLISYIAQGPSIKQIAYSKAVFQEIMKNNDTNIWTESRKTHQVWKK